MSTQTPSQRVLVVGSGGREHALAWKLAQSPHVAEVVVAPGNPGTATEPGVRNVPVATDDFAAIVELVQREAMHLVVIGPEQPLVDGLVDELHRSCPGALVFGPTAAAAALEGSKAFTKQFCEEFSIPTARAIVVRDRAAGQAALTAFEAPPVVKASGLAAGKGVVVPETFADAEAALDAMFLDRSLGSAAEEVLLEERLDGPEVSVLALCDGSDFVLLPPARDHKRLGDNDTGPNTGGMGTFTTPDLLPADVLAGIATTVIGPTLDGMVARGTPFVGVLFAGLMLTADGPKLLEHNCRFGDPETQSVLSVLDADLFELLRDAASGRGSLRNRPQQLPVRADAPAACTVVMASARYPFESSPASPIAGLPVSGSLLAEGGRVFHAGTSLSGDGTVLASGGRVLAVTGTGRDLTEAASVAYRSADSLTFEGAQMRRDIGRYVHV